MVETQYSPAAERCGKTQLAAEELCHCIGALGFRHLTSIKIGKLVVNVADSFLPEFLYHSRLPIQAAGIRVGRGATRVWFGITSALPHTDTAHSLIRAPLRIYQRTCQ